MKEVRLNNGVTIPTPGFGTFLTPDGETAVNSVRCAIEAGFRHIDTAAIYKNEKSVGEGIRQSGIDRQKLFVTSKVWNTNRGYDATLRAFDKTLGDLGMDYLDLYLIHWPANHKQFGDKADWINQETWRALEKLYREGVVRTIGLSNFLPHHIDVILETAEIMPDVDQIEYHPGYTQQACVDYCMQHDIAVEAWSPLGRGNILDNETINAIAARHGKTTAQTVIRWVMQKGIIPLVKSVTPSRIRENLGVFDFELSPADMAAIDSLSAERIGSHPDTAEF